MSYSWNLSELQVIGYADVVGPETAPCCVPPIFRERHGTAVVMPPLHLKGPLVATEVLGAQADLDRAVRNDKATLLPRARAAHPNRILWVDEDLKAHYEKISRNGLVRLARARQRAAERAAIRRDLEEALRNVNVAISADDTNVDSFALKAVLLQHTTDADLVETLMSVVPEDQQRYLRKQMASFRKRFNL